MSKKFNKCLVLGANGFVGRSLVCELVTHFDHVVTYSLDLSEEITLDGVTNIVADFFDEGTLQKAVDGCDVIIHLITTMTPASSNKAPLQDIEQNLLGSVKLLEICRTSSVKKVIYLSSGGTVYGDLDAVEKASETHTTEPSCSYGITKLAFEKYLSLYRQQYDIDSTVLRVSNPYGPLQMCKNSQGVIASFIDKAITGNELQIWGDGTAVRDFIYIDDLVSAIIKSIYYNGNKSVFNIGSGYGVSLNKVLSTIQGIIEDDLKLIYIDNNYSGVSRSVLDNSLAINELGWYPRFSLEEGLKETISFKKK
ncbi:NAD-dependent epimerase/dehydratase family protein [Vibrio splendidus]|uniref:NAD-dependent epimerase/dehydratase family protein n=1 Tax=Vibrio splendidus TaxID=29497 RepID=A0ABV4LT33_VIBSP|nr:NAD-dependent epimerase/dehydratase family protein [Vibrio splendidus]PMH12017.1 hypothetical protein BCU77_05090 [Vibrio splendidus]PMI31403.1 hypothetical protein BCU48_00165 [Vibrio splendidus]PMM38063.1 hypothetical protein BCT55_06655 [Vibrio splendidus]PMO72377.1 hypothetical protein BCT03_16820 [Vibrio splendidus]